GATPPVHGPRYANHRRRTIAAGDGDRTRSSGAVRRGTRASATGRPRSHRRANRARPQQRGVGAGSGQAVAQCCSNGRGARAVPSREGNGRQREGSMSEGSTVADVIRTIAAGSSVDWNAVESPPADASLNGVLDKLRLIARIAEVHGTAQQAASDAGVDLEFAD